MISQSQAWFESSIDLANTIVFQIYVKTFIHFVHSPISYLLFVLHLNENDKLIFLLKFVNYFVNSSQMDKRYNFIIILYTTTILVTFICSQNWKRYFDDNIFHLMQKLLQTIG